MERRASWRLDLKASDRPAACLLLVYSIESAAWKLELMLARARVRIEFESPRTNIHAPQPDATTNLTPGYQSFAIVKHNIEVMMLGQDEHIRSRCIDSCLCLHGVNKVYNSHGCLAKWPLLHAKQLPNWDNIDGITVSSSITLRCLPCPLFCLF